MYDQRGAVLSERVAADLLTLDGDLAALDAVIAMASPDQTVVLIGHSWGAMLASAYLGVHPDRVTRALLIEPGYLGTDGKAAWKAPAPEFMSGARYAVAAVQNGLRATHVTGPDDHPRDDVLIGQMVGVLANHPDNPYHCGEDYTAASGRFGAVARARWRDAPDTDLDRIARGTGYPGPVQLLAGGYKDWTRALLQTWHTALFADARPEVIPNAGPEVIWDNPGAAMPVIRTFLGGAD